MSTMPLQEWITVFVYGDGGTGHSYSVIQPASGLVDTGNAREATFDVQMLGYSADTSAAHSLVLQTATCAEGPWRNITAVNASTAMTTMCIRAESGVGTTSANLKFERYLRWSVSAVEVMKPLETTFKVCVSLR